MNSKAGRSVAPVSPATAGESPYVMASEEKFMDTAFIVGMSGLMLFFTCVTIGCVYMDKNSEKKQKS